MIQFWRRFVYKTKWYQKRETTTNVYFLHLEWEIKITIHTRYAGWITKKHLLADSCSSFDVRTSELHLNALYNNKERERKKHFKKSWKEIDEKVWNYISRIFVVLLLSTKFTVDFSFSAQRTSKRIGYRELTWEVEKIERCQQKQTSKWRRKKLLTSYINTCIFFNY